MIAYSAYESDNRILRYAETLQKNGHRVDVIALSTTKELTDEILNGVNVFRIQHRTRRETAPLSYLFLILLFCWRTMFFLLRQQTKVRYDLVHVHSVPDFLVFAAWLPKCRGAKLILDIHDILPELYASKFGCSENSFIFKSLLRVEKMSTAFADHVIIANDLWDKKIVSRAVPREKCTPIINYPDRSIFTPRGRTRNDGRFILIYPGTLSWHQGLDIAIRAFAKVKDTVPNAEFHIYGLGTAMESLQTLTKELGLEGKVLLLGHRPLREIATILENADLGVVPKRNDSFGDEAFSTKIMEFMSLGVPVVVAETSIDRYYFDDSMVKFFQPGDEASLVEALRSVMTNPELRSRLVNNASRFIASNDWDTKKQLYLEIVSRLVPETTVAAKTPLHEAEQSAGKNGTSLLEEYYRCRPDELQLVVHEACTETPGFFRFGPNITCFGKYEEAHREATRNGLPDALEDVEVGADRCTHISFDPSEVAGNLRYERYSPESPRGHSWIDELVVSAYYRMRPLLSVGIRKHLQRVRLNGWQNLAFPRWPVDGTVDSLSEELLLLCMRNQGLQRIPFIWFWPEGAASCAVLTHDVETATGRDESDRLMDLDDKYGIKASFQVVPEERYEVPPSYIDGIWKRGFEVCVQDLNHDGRLFTERRQFDERAIQINRYRRDYGARGFRSAVLYRNQDWLSALEFEYDMSVPNVAHLDPQRGGCCTVMPYFVGQMVELPVTMTQDYSLFHILTDYSLHLWNRQIELVMERHGLMTFIIHPDYVTGSHERSVFESLLVRLDELRRERGLWIALPMDVSHWWKQRKAMNIVASGDTFQIEGEGKERARIAFATCRNGRFEVEIQGTCAMGQAEVGLTT